MRTVEVMANLRAFLNDPNNPRRLPRLRWYLLGWFATCTVLVVVAYTQLLDYYLELGIELRTQTLLENTSADLEARGIDQVELPRNLKVFKTLDDLPVEFQGLFDVDVLNLMRLVTYTNVNVDDERDFRRRNTLDLCGTQSCDLLFLYQHEGAGSDNRFYLVHGVSGSDAIYKVLRLTERVAFVVGALFIVMLLVLTFLGLRIVDTPIRRLEEWSAVQSVAQAEASLPDLRFFELDAFAQRLRDAFEGMRESVEKEKRFLRHASHELRTPIAILASNVELLDRMTDKVERTEAQAAAFKRQYEALKDIQLLIDTLLWMNRQSEHPPAAGAFDLQAETETLVESHQALLQGKEVAVSVTGSAPTQQLPTAAARIVLSNLIRNAFQYTARGEVLISVQGSVVSISNLNLNHDSSVEGTPDTHSAAVDEETASAWSSEDYGFGFGLELVQLICQRLGWSFDSVEQAGGRVSTVRFPPPR